MLRRSIGPGASRLAADPDALTQNATRKFKATVQVDDLWGLRVPVRHQGVEHATGVRQGNDRHVARRGRFTVEGPHDPEVHVILRAAVRGSVGARPSDPVIQSEVAVALPDHDASPLEAGQRGIADPVGDFG